jgi:hypothetical protein
MKLSFIAAMAGVCLTPALSSAQAVKLQLKYTPGEKFVVATEEKMEQKLSLPAFGQDTDTRISSSKAVLVTTGQPSEGGEIVRTHTVQNMKSDMLMPGGIRIRFDSAKPGETGAPGFPGGAAMVDAMRTSAKVKRIYNYDSGRKLVSAKIAGVDVKALPKELQAQFEPKLLLKTRLEQLKVLPTKEVSPGETWMVSSEMAIGGGQVIKMKSKYTYKGPATRADMQYDYIESEVQDITLEMSGSGPGGLQITESNVKPVNSTGKIWFDRAAGRIAASESRMQMKGTMTMSFNEMPIDSKIDLTVISKTEVKPAK